MALMLCLGERDVQSKELTVRSTVTLDEVAEVDEVDEAAAWCPISRLFAGATILLSSDLEPM